MTFVLLLRLGHLSRGATCRTHLERQVRSLKKSIQDKLDYSKYPELKESDLEEKFIFGSGPGGQKVNKTANCVQLKHVPTGLVVKCHEHREQVKNQAVARHLLRDRVDALLNGDDSIQSQIQRIERQQQLKKEARAAKKRELKKKFRESLAREADAAADQ